MLTLLVQGDEDMNKQTAEVVVDYKIPMPSKLEGITEENFWKYLMWQDDKKILSKKIIDAFKKSAISTSGYNDTNRPENNTETDFIIGDIKYSVKTVLTTKTPSYSDAFDSVSNYVSVLLEQHKKSIKRKDVRTEEGEAYIAVNDLSKKIDNDLNNILKGKEGVSQKLIFIGPKDLVTDIPESINYTFGRDYSAFSDYNARTYRFAELFIKKADKRTNSFKDQILEDSLKTLGIKNKKDLKEIVGIAYSFENMKFTNQLEPRSRPKYADIFDRFIKPAPGKIQKRSVFGDLVKILMIKEQGLGDILKEKNHVDNKFYEDYNPVVKGGKVYIRLQGIKERLSFYKKELSTPSIEQNIFQRPLRIY